MNDSLRLVGAHVKMDVKIPCTLESCSQDIKQIFKEVITAAAEVEPEVVSMDFSEDQTSTRIEVRVRVPLEKVQKEGTCWTEDVCKRLTERAMKTELASILSKTVFTAQDMSQEISNFCVVEAAAVVGFPEHLKGNGYVNCIYACASGMRKISRLSCIPKGRRVYRGIGGVKLPKKFLTEKEGGGRGGVDYAFLSTTTRREVAVSYIGGKALAVLFECELGDIDRGCPLSFISQFPGEDEILIPAMSYLEITGDPYVMETSKGSGVFVTVYPARINCNQKSQTIEEIEARRKNDILSMTFYIQQELLRDWTPVLEVLRKLSEKQTEALDEALTKALAEFASLRHEFHSRDAKDFNKDTTYKDDVVAAIGFKVEKMAEFGRIAFEVKERELNADNFVAWAAKKGYPELIKGLLSCPGFSVDSNMVCKAQPLQEKLKQNTHQTHTHTTNILM
jgi:hypothetical protein